MHKMLTHHILSLFPNGVSTEYEALGNVTLHLKQFYQVQDSQDKLIFVPYLDDTVLVDLSYYSTLHINCRKILFQMKQKYLNSN